MTTIRHLSETLLLTITFLAIIGGLAYLQGEYGNGSEALFKPVFAVIALVPSLIYLVVTGHIRKFSGGGFDIILREQARESVSFEALEDPIELRPEYAEERGRLDPEDSEIRIKEGIERMVGDGDTPTTISLQLGEEELYEYWIIEEYYEILSEPGNSGFRYVLFTGPDGRFEGYMHAEEFGELLSSIDGDIVSELENGRILDRETVSRASVSINGSNQEALREMERRGVTEVAVINSARRFVGVITQEEIFRKVLTSVVRGVR